MSISRIHEKMVRISENKGNDERLDPKSRNYRVLSDILSDYFLKSVGNTNEYCPVCGTEITQKMINKNNSSVNFEYCDRCTIPLTRTFQKGQYVKETIEVLDRGYIENN